MIAEAALTHFHWSVWLVILTDAYHYFTLTRLLRSSQCVTLHGEGADPEKAMETGCDWPRPPKLNPPISELETPPPAAHHHSDGVDWQAVRYYCSMVLRYGYDYGWAWVLGLTAAWTSLPRDDGGRTQVASQHSRQTEIDGPATLLFTPATSGTFFHADYATLTWRGCQSPGGRPSGQHLYIKSSAITGSRSLLTALCANMTSILGIEPPCTHRTLRSLGNVTWANKPVHFKYSWGFEMWVVCYCPTWPL